jgi:hypothetical protein
MRLAASGEGRLAGERKLALEPLVAAERDAAIRIHGKAVPREASLPAFDAFGRALAELIAGEAVEARDRCAPVFASAC